MKKYLLFFAASALLLSCHSWKDDPEEPEENPYKIPCTCGLDWPQKEMTCNSERELPWDYPVKPGTEEWEQLNTMREGINACQIPEDVLLSLSTEDLTSICLQYPFLFSVGNPNYSQGLDRLFEQFNGIRELFKREDVSKELLKHYQCKIKNRLYFEKNESILYIRTLEVLLSRCNLPDDLKENYTDILQQLLCGFEKQLIMDPPLIENQPNLFMNAHFFSRAHLIVKIDEQNLDRIPQKEKNIVFFTGTVDEPTFHAINELTCKIIQKNP